MALSADRIPYLAPVSWPVFEPTMDRPASIFQVPDLGRKKGKARAKGGNVGRQISDRLFDELFFGGNCSYSLHLLTLAA
jgi:hypothetical protein